MINIQRARERGRVKTKRYQHSLPHLLVIYASGDLLGSIEWCAHIPGVPLGPDSDHVSTGVRGEGRRWRHAVLGQPKVPQLDVVTVQSKEDVGWLWQGKGGVKVR